MPRLNTPLLFLIFNRPVETARVFEVIRAQQPKRLFVAADGPRLDRAGEAEIVRSVREIATKVDWPCEVTTLFREENIGCGRAVSEAITWFFSQVEEGIILEDDCLPHPVFFPHCESLLARYRDEPRVASIAGTHFFPATLPHRQSHYASKYFQMWGWATWRRVWQQYDFKLGSLQPNEWFKLLQKTHPVAVEAGYWWEVFQALHAGSIDTWDFQMFFSCWKQGAVHLMPGKNLISNIGYGPGATHTNFYGQMANLPTQSLELSANPIPLEPDPVIDSMIFYLRFLESMTHTWWVEQVLCPEQKLGQARIELVQKTRRIRQLENEILDKRRQLLAATRALAQSAAPID